MGDLLFDKNIISKDDITDGKKKRDLEIYKKKNKLSEIFNYKKMFS